MSVYAVTLVREGKAVSVIVTNGRPREAQTEAATELQEHLRIMTGATIPIVRENDFTPSGGTALILVGPGNLAKQHGVNTKGLEPETFIVKTQGKTLILAGEDGGGGKNARMGTLWAVYDFLQDQLGCRWLWPGEIGRVIPRRRTVEISDLDIRETPLIKQRHFRATLQAKHKKDYERNQLGRFFDMGATYEQLSRDERQWLRRMRMGKSFRLSGGHAFTKWWQRYKDSEPGIFALQADGKRRPRSMKKPEFVKMCVSNPRLWELQLAPLRKLARKGARGLWLNACENDGSGGFCTCARCRAWDANPEIPATAMPEVEDGSDVDGGRDHSNLPESLSNRYARWYNELAKRLRQFDPDGRVIAYAYSRYRSPPTGIKRLEPNIWIGYVGFNAYPRSPEYSKMSRDEWLGWSSRGATVFLRSNSLYYAGDGAPQVFARQMAADFRFQVENGLRATDYDCLQGLWAASGPSYYVQARLLWDTDADVEDLLNEFYSAFGPLAPAVRQYYEYWERFTASLPTHPEIKGRNRTQRIQAFPNVYTHEVMDRAWKILKKAEPLVKQASDEQRQLLHNVILGHRHARLLVAALRENGKTGTGEAGKKLLEFRRNIAPRNVLNVYWITANEMRYRVFE